MTPSSFTCETPATPIDRHIIVIKFFMRVVYFFLRSHVTATSTISCESILSLGSFRNYWLIWIRLISAFVSSTPVHGAHFFHFFLDRFIVLLTGNDSRPFLALYDLYFLCCGFMIIFEHKTVVLSVYSLQGLTLEAPKNHRDLGSQESVGCTML